MNIKRSTVDAIRFLTIIFAGMMISAQATPPLAQTQESQTAPKTALASRYEKWLTEEVVYIITPEETKAFTSLATDGEREQFIEQFWMRRNSDPRAPIDAFKTEHYRRIRYANEHFSCGIPGWKTDRGHIYIVFGQPDATEPHPTGDSFRRESPQAGVPFSVYPFERWTYRRLDAMADNVKLNFIDSGFTNEYALAMSAEDKNALMRVPNAGLTADEIGGISKRENLPVRGALNQVDFLKAKDAPFQRLARYFNVQRPPQIRFTDLKDTALQQVEPNLLPFRWRVDFIGSPASKVLVPITIELNNEDLNFREEMQLQHATVNIYGVITGAQGRIMAEFENAISVEYADHMFEAGRHRHSVYQKTVMLSAGQTCKMNVVLKDLNSNSVGFIKDEIQVPKYDDTVLQASTVILANEVGSIKPYSDPADPFVIGDMRVEPFVYREYKNGQHLIAYFQLYNAMLHPGTSEPSLSISYTVKSGSAVILLLENFQSRSVQFASEERIVIVQAIPVLGMEPGKYELEINIRDQLSGKTLMTNTDFEVIK